jgi:uncharacterized protein (DUF433 family)
MIDWTECEVVERSPEKLAGAWVVRGTRIPVATILANAADGHDASELTLMFPGLAEGDARRVIEFAKLAHAHPA